MDINNKQPESRYDCSRTAHTEINTDLNTIADKIQPSRFSRRKFLQSGVAASPVLMSVKSPMAWACGTTTTHSSVTANMSGNVSSATTCSTAQNPSYWNNVVKCGSGDKHYPMKEALNWCNVSSSTSFNRLFLSDCFNWQKCKNIGWNYKLVANRCDHPSIGTVLPSGFASTVTLRVQRGNNYKKRYDVAINDENLHKYITCGYLNSIFAPDIIAYDYYPRDITNAVNQAVNQLANLITTNQSSTLPLTTPLTTLRDNLGRTWRNW